MNKPDQPSGFSYKGTERLKPRKQRVVPSQCYINFEMVFIFPLSPHTCLFPWQIISRYAAILIVCDEPYAIYLQGFEGVLVVDGDVPQTSSFNYEVVCSRLITCVSSFSDLLPVYGLTKFFFLLFVDI